MSWKRNICALLFILILLVVAGCAHLNGTRFDKYLGKDTDLISFAYTVAENLSERSMPPLVPRHPDMPVLITTFVDNNNLEKTSRLGRLLQEHIASRMVQLGYTVREVKLTHTLNVKQKSGETVLSRDLSLISGELQAQSILAGTISRSDRILYISARLITPTNGNITATYDHQLYMDDNLLALFGLRTQEEVESPISEPKQPTTNGIIW